MRTIRFAVRGFLKARGFTAMALAILAVGIGASTSVFAAIRAVFLRPLPYPQSERLVRLWETKGSSRGAVSKDVFTHWQAHSRLTEELVAVKTDTLNLESATPRGVEVQHVTEGFFRLLGARPLMGRTFSSDEFRDGSNLRVIVSNSFWQSTLGSDPGILGKTIRLSGRSFSVVGVLPPSFAFPRVRPGSVVEAWIPLVWDSQLKRGSAEFSSFGRIKPGVRLEAARDEVAALATGLRSALGDPAGQRSAFLMPMQEDLGGDLRPLAILMSLAVGFTLLIGCANIANLLLARATGRRAEMALRAALGASRSRLVLQLLTECLILAFAGAALGLVLANLGADIIQGALPDRARAVIDVRIDLEVALFAVGAAVVAALVFGLAPAFQTSQLRLSDVLKDTSSRATGIRGRWPRALVVSEVALSVVLVIGAGVLLRSMSKLNAVSLGFDEERLFTAQIGLPAARYSEGRVVTMFFQRLLTMVRALPGVESAATVDLPPLSPDNWKAAFQIAGQPVWPNGEEPDADFETVSSDYFRTLGIRVTRGRGFGPEDNAESQLVAVVNETFARRFLPEDRSLGQRILRGQKTLEVVGVVSDIRRRGPRREPVPEVYIPFAQRPHNRLTLVVRTRGEPMAIAAAVRGQIQTLDSSQGLTDVRTMSEVVADSTSLRRFQTLLISAFATIGLLLASLGIYAVMAYHLSQRTQEMGIRMALGATAGQVQGMIVREGVLLCGLGIVLGTFGALATSRILQNMVFGVGALDPLSYLGAVLVMLLVGLLASWLPSRWATRMDPLKALRGT
jgi:putative ABC transport system permease protein